MNSVIMRVKNEKRILAMLMSLVLMIGILPVTALAVDVINSGEYGDNLMWELDVDGTLTISGVGPMESLIDGNPNAESVAWEKYRDKIKSVIIDSELGEGSEAIVDTEIEENSEIITEKE